MRPLLLFVCLLAAPVLHAGVNDQTAASLARDVRAETLRTWNAYAQYAWPHDELLPLSRGYHDWYADSLSIAPIDAYSTLKIMGFTARRSGSRTSWSATSPSTRTTM